MHIPLYVWLPAALLAAFYCGLFFAGLAAAAGRPRRRGGYVKPPASPGTKVATRTTPSAQGLTADTKWSSRPGLVSEAWETPRMLRDPSRLTGRGWSTLGTESHGGSGAPPASAA